MKVWVRKADNLLVGFYLGSLCPLPGSRQLSHLWMFLCDGHQFSLALSLDEWIAGAILVLVSASLVGFQVWSHSCEFLQDSSC